MTEEGGRLCVQFSAPCFFRLGTIETLCRTYKRVRPRKRKHADLFIETLSSRSDTIICQNTFVSLWGQSAKVCARELDRFTQVYIVRAFREEIAAEAFAILVFCFYRDGSLNASQGGFIDFVERHGTDEHVRIIHAIPYYACTCSICQSAPL